MARSGLALGVDSAHQRRGRGQLRLDRIEVVLQPAHVIEADLARRCEQLRDLGWWRLLKKAATRGQKRFPRNPFFPYFEAVAHLVPENRLYGPPAWKVEPLFRRHVARLIRAGRLTFHETRREGIENALDALLDVLKGGRHLGKMVVDLGT